MNKSNDYWPKIALTYSLQEGQKSIYTSYLTKWTAKCHTSLTTIKDIKQSVLNASINSVKEQNRNTQLTCFAMNMPNSSKQRWFKPRTWVSDCINSKTLSQFRCCNAGLGNRGPTATGRYYKLCPLCNHQGVFNLNNEVHLAIDCPSLSLYRNNTSLGSFIAAHRWLNPSISSLKLYSMFLDDSDADVMNKRGSDLFSLKVAWEQLVDILPY